MLVELKTIFDAGRKGSMPLRTVAKIVLAIMAVALIFAGVSGWISEMGSNFVKSITYPTN